MSTANQHTITPKLGEGIYRVKDISNILKLDYDKVYRWINGYWDSNLEQDLNYTFGDKGNKVINFFSLIEFYTFFKLREKGVSPTEIRKLHHELSAALNTKYPFAIAQDYYIEKRKKKNFVYYRYLESLIKLHPKKQFSLDFIASFLDKIEFDDNNLAKRFFPLDNSKNVVVDPKNQFGQPIIEGTNIKTETIYSLYRGGETNENISILYNLSDDKVKDAINFHLKAA